jgi:DNA-3-methyladenine glycosylase II
MAELIARSRRYNIMPAVSIRPFDALAESIAYQQLSGKAAATIFGRVRALYPKRKWLDPELLLATPDEKLRAAGLSRAKTAALKDLAAKTIDGTVPSGRALIRMTDDEIVMRLTAVRGIGRWTVEMLLLFDLGRPDVWPVDDYGVRKGFAKTFGRRKLPTPKQLMKFGEKWRPYRSMAAWYFWRALDAPEESQS